MSCAPAISFASSAVTHTSHVQDAARTPRCPALSFVCEGHGKARDHRQGQGHREVMALFYMRRYLAGETRKSVNDSAHALA
jgi:hypothetical protein